MPNPDIASRFDEIYDSTYKAALAFVTAKCRNAADVGDILQDTYMELYQVLTKRGAGYIINERAFVLRLAKQKISRHYSLLERLKIFVPMSATNEQGEEMDLSDAYADSFLTEDFVADQALLESIKEQIQAKPEDVQKIFYLTYEAELSISEIAQALSMNESNVKNKLYRTLKEIRKTLNQ
jgi:RNA polymerase sigma-70 factor (ECF subfamily)